MSSAAPTRAARDPGRMYPPPPVTTWGAIVRWGLTVLFLLGNLGVLMIAAVAGEQVSGPWRGPWRWLGEAVALVASVLLIRQRRRWPVAVSVALTSMSLVSLAASCFTPWALVSLCTRRRWREVVPVAAFTILVTWVAGFVLGTADNTVMADGQPVEPLWLARLIGFVFASLMVAVYVGFGFYVGARRDLIASLTERAETAEREQQLMVEAGQASERARIAREMHDVLAHRISLVSMHAGALAFREDLPPEKVREIAALIQENSHASLTELRTVLSALREPTALGEVEKPQPTAADLTALIHEARLGGMTIVVDDQFVHAEQLPPTIGRHVYRMVQEALTNARKHAVGAPVHVLLAGRPGQGVTLEVRNALTGAAGLPGSRLGLVGLAERAQMVGGRFEAKREHGDFVVKAWLPWEK